MPTNRIPRQRFFRPLLEQLEDRRLLAAFIRVNSTADANTRDTALTLREAILINNRTLAVASLTAAEQAQVVGTPTNADADTIQFVVAGAGVTTISPTTALPTITDPVTINGYTQQGASPNSNPPDQPLNTVLLIELAGNLSGGATGLRLGAGSGGSTIRGLAINRFSNAIWLDSGDNTIAGNFLGTNPGGTAALPNTANGVLIIDGDNNSIGGTGSGDANLISGNATNGITIVTNAAGTIVRGNRIGTDLTGTVDLGNTTYGVFADLAPGTIIGGSTAGAGNLISGNNSHAIVLQNASHDSVIQGNKIGTTLSGTAALANSGDGVRIETSIRLAIGGIPGGNTIAFNTGTGIRDVAASSLYQANSIFANGQLGIDRGLFAGQTYPPSLFDFTYPILTEVSETVGVTTVKGLFPRVGTAQDFLLRMEFFANSQADASGFGEGQTYLGFVELSTGGNDVPTFTATLPALPAGQPLVTATMTDITATGGNPVSLTSEFSPPLAANMTPAIQTVTTTADSGAGSLRAALQAANSHPGPDRIEFNVPASDAGHVYYKNDNVANQVTLANVTPTTAATDAAIADIDPDWPHSWFTFRPTTPLPQIDDPYSTIDGYTQPGSVQNTNPTTQGLNSILRIEINGAASQDPNIDTGQLNFGGSFGGYGTARGLVVRRTVTVGGFFGSNRVEGNYVGADVSGTLSFPVMVNGYSIGGTVSVGGSGSVIGGTAPAARNLLANVVVSSGAGSATGVRVEGNLVGTDRAGLVTLAGGGGVTVQNESIIGGSDPAARNVIAGSVSAGGPFGGQSLVQNNLVGTDVTGTTTFIGNHAVLVVGTGNRVLQNTVKGGYISVAGNDNQVRQNSLSGGYAGIGGIGASGGIIIGGSRNQVTQNSIVGSTSDGIRVGTGTQNLLSQNTIAGSAGIGINLLSLSGGTAGGVTLNDVPPASDPPDQDTGPNNLQNYPVLTAVTAVGGGTQIEGTLASTPSSNFRLEFFANAERDEASNGLVAEGQTYLGSLDVTTNASGNATFSVDFPVNLLTLPGERGQPFVTVTASDITDTGSGPRSDTSEFSATVPLGGPTTTVTSTADAGLGTLREAITVANIMPGRETVTFAIPATDPRHFYYRDDGVVDSVKFENTATTNVADDSMIADIDPDWPHSWFSVNPLRVLPAIVDTITIDGYSQPASTPNTLLGFGQLNTVLKVELSGNNAAGDGLQLSWSANDGVITEAANSVIRGVAINSFPGNGVTLRTLSGSNRIEGAFIGTDVSGMIGLGNSLNGVWINRESNSRIGGLAADSRSLIAGNWMNGIKVDVALATEIQGNILNGDPKLVRLVPSGAAPISVDLGRTATSLNQGATQLAAQQPSPRAPGAIDKNIFGLGLTFHVPNEFWAMQIQKHAETSPGADTALAVSGMLLHSKLREPLPSPRPIPITFPSPFQSYLGIDLNGDGVTSNDVRDADTGPNSLQNFPVLISGTSRAGGTTIAGFLDSSPNERFRIEFYGSSFDTTIIRAGERSLGTIDVSTNESGDATFIFDTEEHFSSGYEFLALATHLIKNDEEPQTSPIPYETSEFSAGIPVRENPWHNKLKPLDADPDGKTVPGDALVIINRINAAGSGLVPPEALPTDPYRYDTSNDAYVAPNDALVVINYINQFGAEREGEGEGTEQGSGFGVQGSGNGIKGSGFGVQGSASGVLPPADLIALLALDIAVQPKRRRG